MIYDFLRNRGTKNGEKSGKGEKRPGMVKGLRAWLKVFGGILLAGCSMNPAFSKNVPYGLKARMVIEPSEIYEMAGLDFSFLNKSDKEVKEITIVFFMYDEEGNAPGLGPNNAQLEIRVDVEPGELLEDCLSLDSFLYEIPDQAYQLDYLYVSRILYGDGSEWSDPFGLYSVN